LANSSTITITLKDPNGNLIGGKPVALTFVGASEGGSVTTPSSTNPSGVTFGTLSSTTGGTYVVSATVGGGTPVTINQTPSATFVLTFAGEIEPLFTVGHPNADPSGGTTTACSSCHLPYLSNGSVPDLSFAHLTDIHDGKPVVEPGSADKSLLIQSLEHDVSISASEQMPSATQRLPVEVIAKIRRWIDQSLFLRP
jgi:hypothetical protein